MSDEPALDIDPNAEWDGSQAVVGDTSDTGASRQEPPNERGKGIPLVEELFHPRLVEGLHADHKQRRAAGRRSHSRTTRKQGRYITSRNLPQVTDLAFDATVRAAAPYQRARRNALNQHGNDPNNMRSAARPTLLLHRHDMRQKVRTRRTRNAVCFVVDASWSMAAEQRMAVTRMAILSLLRDAYQRRDYVGLVSFQRSYATVLLPLTNSVELAQASLQTMPIGGKTPLSRGLLTGYKMLEHARRQDEEIIPLLVVITDGQANVAMGNKPPHIEAYEIAAFIAKQHIRSVVIDTDQSGGESLQGFSGITSAHITRADVGLLSYEGGLASDLATYLQGEYYQLDDLDAHRITDIARNAQLP